MKKVESHHWLHTFIKEARKNWNYGLFFTFISTLGYILFAYFVAQIIGKWLLNQSVEANEYGFSVLGIVIKYMFSFFAGLQNNIGGKSAVSKIKAQLLPCLLSDENISAQNAADYYNHLPENSRSYFSGFIPSAMATVLIACICLIFFFWMDKIVGIILLFSMALIPLQMIAVGYGAQNIHEQHINLFLHYSNVFYNRTNALPSIQNLGNFNQQYAFLKEKGKTLTSATMKVMQIAMLSSALMEFFITASIAMVAVYLGLSLLGFAPFDDPGTGYSYPKALFILLLTPYYYVYFRKFVAAYHDRNRALAMADVLYPVIQKSKKTVINKSTNNFVYDSSKLDRISFHYPGNQNNVLSDISYSLPKHGLIWVKGISGSGKSTLLKIIAGRLQPQKGNVYINNQVVSDNSALMQNNVVYMNQHPYIFEETILFNILLGEKLTDCQMDNILKQSQLGDVVPKKTNGIHTLLTNNGAELSGGEKQLLHLARVIAHPKPVFILDEPTASLDPDTSKKIIQMLSVLAQTHLVIVASHEQQFDGVANQKLELNWGQLL